MTKAPDGVWDLIATERRRAADLVGSLTAEQLDTPSLCAGWTVRDVAAHLTMPFSVGAGAFVVGVVRHGGFAGFNDTTTKRLARRPVPDLVQTLRDNATTTFSAPGIGPYGPLTDLCVHVRDMARPLGLATTAAPDAWRAALEFLVSPKAARGFVPPSRTSGLRLVATDLGWSAGEGAELTGPAEAVALVVTGRKAALRDVHGVGAERLKARLSAG